LLIKIPLQMHPRTYLHSERFEKIGRGFIKILETWQFGLSFFDLAKKKNLSLFYEFLKNFGLAQKKNRKITLLAVNNAFFNRFSD
jgi:hypothetical protein